MVLALAACAAGVFAFGTAGAQAAGLGLGLAHASGQASAPQAKGPKPKEYTLCTEYFGDCGAMFVYKKTSTWETTSICWIDDEFPECPGLGYLGGSYVKEAKGKVTYYFNGPFGESDVGNFDVTKVKRSHPPLYEGLWTISGDSYGEVAIET